MSAGTSRLEAVAGLLEQLDGQAGFRLTGGPLGARLREAVMAELDADTVESLADRDYDIFVSIDAHGGAVSAIDCRLECDGAEYAAEVALADLSGRQLHELSLRLLALIEARLPAGRGAAGRVVIRRKSESDRYDILQATQKLKVTAEWLKSTIPCTGYGYEETGGRKAMRDCFWSRELIERLCRVKESRPRREDEQYVAGACCDGDLGWAKEIIRSLRKPEPKTPQIGEKFAPRIKSQVISRQFVNEPAPKRKKKGAETGE
jgi:hypothetical protein